MACIQELVRLMDRWLFELMVCNDYAKHGEAFCLTVHEPWGERRLTVATIERTEATPQPSLNREIALVRGIFKEYSGHE